MGVAFERACRRLGLSLPRDAASENVAAVIISLAEQGEPMSSVSTGAPWRTSAKPVEAGAGLCRD
jgi:hypothetical protein